MLNGLMFPLALLLAGFGIRDAVLTWPNRLPTRKILGKALLVIVCAGLAYQTAGFSMQEFFGRPWLRSLAVVALTVAAVCMAVVLTRQLWMMKHRM